MTAVPHVQPGGPSYGRRTQSWHTRGKYGAGAARCCRVDTACHRSIGSSYQNYRLRIRDRAIKAFQSQTGDLALQRFGMINFQLAEILARSVKPTGVLDVSLQQDLQRRLRNAKNASADMAGRKRGIHVGLGVEPGVIVLQRSATATCVFALELKRENRRNRKPTAHEISQAATRRRLSACGCDTGVAYGLDEALAWLESRGLLRKSVNS
jgi:hypothetical protein